jgi:predicted PurR-regulated permease PerM
MDRQISISTGTFVKAIIIGAGAYALWILKDLVLLVLTAVVLASAVEPGVAFFVKHRIPRVFAVVGLYIAIFGSLFSIFYVFIPPVLDDSQSFLQSVPQYLDTLNLPDTLTSSETKTGAQGEAQSLLNGLNSFRTAFTDPSQGAVRLVASSFGGIFSLVLVIVLSVYFAILDTGVEDFLRLIAPSKYEDYVASLWNRARKKIGLWMQGQLLSSLIGAIIAYLGLAIFGVPYPLLLAVFTGLLMLVPVFGSFVATIPPLIVAFSAGGVTMLIYVLILYLIINQLEAHLIHPLVVKYVTGIPPLMVILALIAGSSLAGFLGVLLSVPLAATLRELLNDVEKEKRKERAARTA